MTKTLVRLLFTGGAGAALLGTTALKSMAAPLWLAGGTCMAVALVTSFFLASTVRSETQN